jgi:hypothetical protein
MKHFFAVLAVALMTLFAAHAQYYPPRYAPVQAQVSFTNFQVSATVINRFYRPIICSGYAYGQTFYGNVFNSYMNNVVVYPGNYAQVYVYNYNSNRFVNAWSNIRCNWY